MTWRRLTVAACAAVLLAPGTALAGFSSQVLDVSGPSTNDVFPATATDVRGESIVLWKESAPGSNLLRFRRVRPDGSMGSVTTVSDGSLIIAQKAVAMAPDGRALTVWSESATGTAPLSLRARWIEQDDSLGPQIPVRDGGATSSVDEPAVAATSDGDAVVAWRNSRSTPNGLVEARRVDASGGLGTLLQPTEGPNVAATVDVAPNAAGGALLAWVAPPGIVAMPVDAGGAPGTVRTPVAAGVLGLPRLSGGAPGEFHLLWLAQGPPQALSTLTIDAAGLATGTVKAIDPDTSAAASFQLATNATGRSLAFSGHADAVVAARLFGPDGTPDAASFTAPADQQFTVAAGVLGDGTAIALWSQGPSGSPRSLVARVIGPDGSAGAPQVLSPLVDSADFSSTGSGIGIVAWQQRPPPSGTDFRVRARQYLPAPVCADAAGTVVQGGPIALTLSCTGLQLTAPQVVNGPAHGTLGPVDAASGRVVYTPVPGFDGADAFTFRGANPGGLGAVQTARIQVGRDTVAPRVTRFGLSVRTIRLRTSFRRPRAKRPAFVVGVSEASRVRITIRRKIRGRFRPFRVVRVPRVTTTVTLPLAKRRLRPGAYRATVVLTDPAGNASASRRLGFVVRRR